MGNCKVTQECKDLTPINLRPKQIKIIDCLVTGKNQTETAKIVGVSREYVNRLCRQDHILREIDRRLMNVKTMLAPRMSANVANLADNAESERIRLDASLGILDRTGHSKGDQNRIEFRHEDLVVHIDLS